MQNEESRQVMSFEDARAFNDGWKRGEAYGRKQASAEIAALRGQLDKTREFCDIALRAKVAESSPAECAMAALAAVIKREALEVTD